MAYDPTLPIIDAGGGQKAPKELTRRALTYDFGTFVIEERPMDDVWPAGDPVPRDKETLVIFISRSTQKECHELE